MSVIRYFTRQDELKLKTTTNLNSTPHSKWRNRTDKDRMVKYRKRNDNVKVWNYLLNMQLSGRHRFKHLNKLQKLKRRRLINLLCSWTTSGVKSKDSSLKLNKIKSVIKNFHGFIHFALMNALLN